MRLCPRIWKKPPCWTFTADCSATTKGIFFDLYYNEDLSLGEIAENAGITRQAVLGNIRKAEKNLEAFEKKLGLLKRHEQNLKITEKMTGLIKSTDCDGDDELLRLISRAFPLTGPPMILR